MDITSILNEAVSGLEGVNVDVATAMLGIITVVVIIYGLHALMDLLISSGFKREKSDDNESGPMKRG